MFTGKFWKITSPSASHDCDYRLAVGPPEAYDIMGAMQFNLLTFLGLRDYHFLLDVGCGSLRAGRLFIPYLLPGRYFGIEPDRRLIEWGIKKEIGKDIIKIKKPTFNNNKDLMLSVFKRKFNFILATSIFTHTTQQQIKTCLLEAKKIMKPDSFFCATFLLGEKNNTDHKWSPHFKPVSYTAELIKRISEDCSFFCRIIDWPHPLGHKWAIIVNPENEKNLPDFNYIKTDFKIEKVMYLGKVKLLSRVRKYNYFYQSSKTKKNNQN